MQQIICLGYRNVTLQLTRFQNNEVEMAVHKRLPMQKPYEYCDGIIYFCQDGTNMIRLLPRAYLNAVSYDLVHTMRSS